MSDPATAAIISRFSQPGESWNSIVERVAAIGDQRVRAQYRQLISDGLFVPGGQILRGAGRGGAVLYNCFVSGAEAAERPTEIAARVSAWTSLGAGVGVNLDDVASFERERGRSILAVVETIARSQDQLWRQGLKRTATMITLSLSDPEVRSVSRLLTSAEHFRHLNLGVLVSDREMESGGEQLEHLAQSAWESGNPGFIFIDRVRRDHGFSDDVRTCNPCAEQFLAKDEGCNLGSLNLEAFCSNSQVDWLAFKEAAGLAVRFLDDVIDVSTFPSVETERLSKRRRRIGLGVMGFSSALQKLGIVYGSPECLELAGDWAACLRDVAETSSQDLAAERGAFPDCSDGKRRNSHLLSIAPTGAISLLWSVSSGIEPFFGELVRKGGLETKYDSWSNGQPLTAIEVPPSSHVNVLASWQQRVDGGISKTINLSATATPVDVRTAIMQAWKSDCKGVSVFRDKSRSPAIEIG